MLSIVDKKKQQQTIKQQLKRKYIITLNVCESLSHSRVHYYNGKCIIINFIKQK